MLNQGHHNTVLVLDLQLGAWFHGLARHDELTVSSIGCEQAVVAHEMGSGTGNQGGQAGDEVSGLEQHVVEPVRGGRVIMVAMQLTDNIELFFNWARIVSAAPMPRP